MGVNGLWQILQPCARPIKIETLNRKRLAVDASIWIYQFLKAVRDKEGNALRNSHVVGFFRRICKLLFFGIKPVFVFDGGAPTLKRQTIRARKSRREGRREDAVRTAGKLLAVQMQRRAEEEEAQRMADRERANTGEEEETVPDEGLVYVDELQMSQQERQQNRKFRKKDQYHLPDLDMSLSEMGGPNDPRVMSLEELQSYARQFEAGEDINVYDFSKIDYDSQFFMSLPPSDRYNILNAARLRSRLRMGHSKEQLDSMFPDRMAFSKFQIERVRERNELTQRLMHLNGFETMEFGGGRVAGEKGREYVLVKNDGVEGGWALGVITDEGKEEKPIDIDQQAPVFKSEDDNEEDDDEEDEEDFEDIPIEGLNRLPKRKTRNEEVADELMKQRRAVYRSKGATARRKPKRKAIQDPNSLFVQSSEDDAETEEWEEVGGNAEPFGEDDQQNSEDEDLRKAIAMSMEKDHAEASKDAAPAGSDAEDEDMLDFFQQSAVEEQRPLPKGSGRAIANIVNKRAFNVAPESREVTSFGVPTQRPDESDSDDSMDFQAALAESRKTKRKTSPPRRPEASPSKPQQADPTRDIVKKAGFSGPLPFEKLDLGSSLLGKKKMQQRTEETAGGFENPEMAQKEKKKAEPLPPWFTGDIEEDMKAQQAIEREDRERAIEFNKQFQFQDKGGNALRRADTSEVIDLEADESDHGFKNGVMIDLDADEPAASPDVTEEIPMNDNPRDKVSTTPVDDKIRMGDMADEIRIEPEIMQPSQEAVLSTAIAPERQVSVNADRDEVFVEPGQSSPAHNEEDDIIEWSESEHEYDKPKAQSVNEPIEAAPAPVVSPARTGLAQEEAEVPPTRSASPELEFEDVQPAETRATKPQRAQSQSAEPGGTNIGVPNAPPVYEEEEEKPAEHEETGSATRSGLIPQETIPEDEEFDDFSDPEEAEMLRALTLEAEEHARFASSLNNKSQRQNVQDYEEELKKLRNQQKKDRRDADEVTQIMIQECQALLRLFGLPYITAPMEAEAQCAELVKLSLVDGIVTDDSDCFLFGGTRIYKNMFNQAKFVECYLTSDLEKEFDLTRDKLIAVAHLLGSDYTEGLPGVGPVTALEIISEFGSLDGFKEWWTCVQMNQIPKSEDSDKPFRKKFRKNATKLFLPPAFPDKRVEVAYLEPDVDATPEPFQWGVPDLNALRSFLMATIGWSQERTDEVLVPVIKDMNRRMDEGTQANITAFFDGSVGIGSTGASNASGKVEGFTPRKRVEGSKRMGSALSRMAERAKLNRTGSRHEGDAQQQQPEASDASAKSVKAASKKRKSTKANKAATPPASQSASEDDASEFEEPKKKKLKKRVKAPARGNDRREKAATAVEDDDDD